MDGELRCINFVDPCDIRYGIGVESRGRSPRINNDARFDQFDAAQLTTHELLWRSRPLRLGDEPLDSCKNADLDFDRKGRQDLTVFR